MNPSLDTTNDTENEDETQVLATPDEQLKQAIQMKRVQEYTVRPGLLRLPVDQLASAANSPQYKLQLDHPYMDDANIRYFIPKPDYWDTREFLWPRLLDWYGYGANSQYQLQTDRVYVAYNRRTDEWELTSPPTKWTQLRWRTQDALAYRLPNAITSPASALARRLRDYRDRVRSLTPRRRTAIAVTLALGTWVATFLGILVDNFSEHPATLGELGGAAGVSTLLALWLLVTYAVAFEPPGGDG